MKKRRITSIFLTLALLLALAVPATAAETAAISFKLSSGDIQKIAAGTALLEEDGKLALGSVIPAYYWDNEDFSVISDIAYMPVSSGNEVVGIVTALDPNSSSPAYSVGKQFAAELNSAIKENGSSYCLVFNGSQTFYYGNGKAVLLSESKPGLLPFDASDVSVATGDEPTVTPLPTMRNASNREIYYDFTVDDLEADAMKASDELSFSTNAAAKSVQSAITLNTAVSRANDYVRLPVGLEDQGDTMLCWAVSTVLTGSYRTDIYDYDMYDIADELDIGYYDGGNNLDIIDGLDIFYDITGTSRQGYYSYDNTQYWIDRDKPIIALAYSSGGGLGHTVTVCGYYYDHDSIIWSESYGNYAGKYCYTTANSNGTFTFTTNGVRYTWKYSVTV